MNEEACGSCFVVPGSLTAVLEAQGQRRGHRLLVVVDVEIEATREVALVAAVPQGINPQIKLLRVRTGPPAAGVSVGTTVRRTLRYEESPAAVEYREVWLGGGDAAISAKVSVAM